MLSGRMGCGFNQNDGFSESSLLTQHQNPSDSNKGMNGAWRGGAESHCSDFLSLPPPSPTSAPGIRVGFTTSPANAPGSKTVCAAFLRCSRGFKRPSFTGWGWGFLSWNKTRLVESQTSIVVLKNFNWRPQGLRSLPGMPLAPA